MINILYYDCRSSDLLVALQGLGERKSRFAEKHAAKIHRYLTEHLLPRFWALCTALRCRCSVV